VSECVPAGASDANFFTRRPENLALDDSAVVAATCDRILEDESLRTIFPFPLQQQDLCEGGSIGTSSWDASVFTLPMRLGAALLISRGLVQQEVRAQDLDLDDSEAIDLLAKRFQVSTVAMSYRLQNLRMLAYEN
jgi:hypothetical protein